MQSTLLTTNQTTQNHQQQQESQYIAIVLTQFRSSERDLYPLTKNYPLALFPIGNKKLIIYQLEMLAKCDYVNTIVIQVNETNSIIEEFITRQFLIQYPQFPKRIEFYKTVQHQNNFLRLVGCVQYISNKISTNYKGLVVTVCDTLVNFQLQQLINYHQSHTSDMTLLLKKKKQLTQQQKKAQQPEQTEIDNILISENGRLLFIDMLEQYQNNGVKIPSQVYRRANKAQFKKVVDSKVYIINSQILQIIKHLNSTEIDDVKPWLVQCLVENQCNKTLLRLNKNNVGQNQVLRPLNVFAMVTQQDVFIKKVSNKKVYENLNFDSLMRGAKQKDYLLPTQYTPFSQSADFKGSLVMRSTTVSSDSKLVRSVIGGNCKIGKKVDIMRSIIMDGVEIRDNCKIHDCVIGSGVVIGGDCAMTNSYVAAGCKIADGAKIDNQMKIPMI